MGSVQVPVNKNYKAREDGSTMKALAWFGNGDVRMIDAPVPDITQPVRIPILEYLSQLIDCF